MDSRFAQVKVLVWDFDGTLYKPNPELWREVRQAEYRVIKEHTGWSKDKVTKEFAKLHKKVYPSATEVVARLSHLPVHQAAVEMEEYFDRRNFLSRDEKLITLFAKLKKFRHFTLANGALSKQKQTLKVLGISPKVFEEMITSEVVGVTKPHAAGWRYILNKTLLPPGQHLMIGDREEVDLAPAKKLGMKTCLVWAESRERGGAFDVILPTVYEVATVLL